MSLRLGQVGVTYNDGTPALDDICLTIDRQEQVALIGPSGSGKSSLLRIMSMALAPSTGSVALDEQDPWQQKTARLQRMRGKIHLCPQSAPLPARQRVALAVLSGLLPTRSLAFALRSLMFPARADVELAHGFLSSLDVEQHLWRPVETLSGGQKQRVAIARAMACEAEYLFVDEPLSALDPSSSELCLSTLLNHVTQNSQSIVCSLHQVELARSHLSRIIGLRQGRVLFDLPAEDVDEPMIESLYRGYESELRD
ncbi:phosphonate ABC transporter ATP-binding protein [Granulosicoccus antarcticus]|uniref:Carnitine transport ATP-binding protein OpuCA n=1 Tax=Granulosicoccus antarcticus IMCC3135 TaxID=1192854 RepID=A0A2Z2NT90_9GAMM|nr:ATP-binding cassette domain-containing protein [Granulosicoccus antarcticus]ASJ74716.1 Carnitine transport ATP-binding protein OpuCA [Granulosicoccus antarcticus IMCC3135]